MLPGRDEHEERRGDVQDPLDPPVAQATGAPGERCRRSGATPENCASSGSRKTRHSATTTSADQRGELGPRHRRVVGVERASPRRSVNVPRARAPGCTTHHADDGAERTRSTFAAPERRDRDQEPEDEVERADACRARPARTWVRPAQPGSSHLIAVAACHASILPNQRRLRSVAPSASSAGPATTDDHGPGDQDGRAPGRPRPTWPAKPMRVVAAELGGPAEPGDPHQVAHALRPGAASTHACAGLRERRAEQADGRQHDHRHALVSCAASALRVQAAVHSGERGEGGAREQHPDQEQDRVDRERQPGGHRERHGRSA